MPLSNKFKETCCFFCGFPPCKEESRDSHLYPYALVVIFIYHQTLRHGRILYSISRKQRFLESGKCGKYQRFDGACSLQYQGKNKLL